MTEVISYIKQTINIKFTSTGLKTRLNKSNKPS